MDISALITEVSIRQPIWDITHKDHFNPLVTNVLWFEIEEKLGYPKDMCKRKWRYVRDQYRRETIKLCGMYRGEPEKLKVTWRYYKELSFLKKQLLTGDLSRFDIDFDKNIIFEPLKSKENISDDTNLKSNNKEISKTNKAVVKTTRRDFENQNTLSVRMHEINDKTDIHSLIAAVFVRTPIWDSNHKDHLNPRVTNLLWYEIEENLRYSKYMCRSKWKYLRHTYRQIILKICGMYCGKPPIRRCKWPYYKRLSFLKGEVLTGDLSHLDHDFDKNIIFESQEYNLDNSKRNESTIKRRKYENINLENEIIDSDSSNHITRPQTDITAARRRKCIRKNANKNLSEDSLFFQSLLDFMKEFKPAQKLKVRKRIQQAILEECK